MSARDDYTAWFTDYPATHVKAGETVEVVPRALLEEARAQTYALQVDRDRMVRLILEALGDEGPSNGRWSLWNPAPYVSQGSSDA